MKYALVLLPVVCLTVAAASCAFNREPLIRADSLRAADAAAASEPKNQTHAMDAAAAGSGKSEDAASPSASSDASTVTHPTADAGQIQSMVPVDPPAQPMTGGLQCEGVFCPFAVDPAKPCCTTETDVAQHTARAAGRCGLDLGGLTTSSYGDGCWQRDQLGIVDDRCPSVVAEKGGMPEPGCCTDNGECGTLNANQKLGCRHPNGQALRSCTPDEIPNSTCDPSGTYGLHFVVDTAWGGRSGGLWALTDDGRGKIEVYVLATVHGYDRKTGALDISGRACGVTLPAFYSSTLCESYRPLFPEKIWDARDVPQPALTGRYECSSAGCTLSIEPRTYLLGFDMKNPEAPWPTSDQTSAYACRAGKGVACFPDHDSDGDPGVQVDLMNNGWAPPARSCTNGYPYRGAPLSASAAAIFDGVRRTDRLFLGVRLKLGTTLRLATDCSNAQGAAVAEYVNSRAAGCLVQEGTFDFPETQRRAGPNEPCQPSEAQFLDANLPVYEVLSAGIPPKSTLSLTDRSPSRGPETKSIRLGGPDAAISCADVRAAKY